MVTGYSSSQLAFGPVGSEQKGGKRKSGNKSPSRSFKVIKVDGKNVTPYGRYTGDPSAAANKAFTQLSRKHKKTKVAWTCKLTVRESTSGSDKKEFSYKGVQTKLSKPIERKFPNGTSGMSYVERKVISV